MTGTIAALLLIPALSAEVLLTTDEALALAFPGCTILTHTHYLSFEQRREAAERGGVPVESGLLRRYQGQCEGADAGSAYFDTHPVRELPATLMVVVGPDGRVARVELLSFEGYEQHRPPPSYYDQIRGLSLSRELSTRRAAVRPISGATLSSRAAVEATRRVLALHEVILGSP